MRARTLIAILFSACALALAQAPRAAACQDGTLDPCSLVFDRSPDFVLPLTIAGSAVTPGAAIALPIGETLPVRWSLPDAIRPLLDGSDRSQNYWDFFYLDFFKGTLFSDASFISGAVLNPNEQSDPRLREESAVAFPEPGEYSAIVYDSSTYRDNDPMCAFGCPDPGHTIDEMRAGIARGPGPGRVPPLALFGTVSFSVLPAPPALSSVLFLPGIEASRLYYRDANGSERQLWEPSIASDIPLLSLGADGAGAPEIYTRDIIDSLYGNYGWLAPPPHLDPADLEVYGDFARFMDRLAASTTVAFNGWRAYPYDWRYDVRAIAEQGTLVEAPGDASPVRVYLEDVVGALASSSATGRVTVIAHSNGGLLAKALMEKLERDGKSALVDRLILIGSPQWGTPASVGALLHGDGGTLGLGLIARGEDVRAAAATMPGAYGLLPSPRYFASARDPVIRFAADGGPGTLRDRFPEGITSFAGLAAFLTDAFGLDAGLQAEQNLNVPLALPSALVAGAESMHAALDAWTPPAGVAVTKIAGWG